MYKDFFGLQQYPFKLTPDPSFLYLPPKHREALAGLTYAFLERKGFTVLTGDAGTGKTTLIHSVLSHLPENRVESSIMLNPTLTASEFLEGVLLDFDLPDVPASKAQRLWKLHEFLARIHRENRLALLVIDEAHKCSLDVLEEIRLLGNFESSTGKFLQILLSGQSELDDLLNRQDLRQFKQRIAMRLYINPLIPSEVPQYIRFRWAKAGGREAAPFTRDAIGGIVNWSQGIPRLINSICDSALLMAFGDESARVGLNYVRAAAVNLALADPLALSQAQPPAPNPIPIAAVPSMKQTGPQILIPEVPEQSAMVSSAAAASAFSSESMLSCEVPSLAHYSDPRPNSTLLKRLAERFGLPR